jgi:hypothetical protein
MKKHLILVLLVTAACTKSSTTTQPSPPTRQNITGTWQGAIDAGTRIALLQFILIEDAGTLTGRELVNDPSDATEFHTLDTISGTHNGRTVMLHTALSGDTINATLDGRALSGIEPATDPFVSDGGVVTRLNLPFSMTRISTSAPVLDGGSFQ